MFKFPQHDKPDTVTIIIEGSEISVPRNCTVAAAVLASGLGYTRTTFVSGSPRAPLCMMGVCYECLMVIDGRPTRRACQQIVREGMHIERQLGVGPAG